MGIGAWVDVEELGQNTLNLHVVNVPTPSVKCQIPISVRFLIYMTKYTHTYTFQYCFLSFKLPASFYGFGRLGENFQ